MYLQLGYNVLLISVSYIFSLCIVIMSHYITSLVIWATNRPLFYQLK